MLNKLSFNLMNELNESETKSYKIKKKVIMESNCVKTEDCNVELNNSEEPTHQVLNEENSDAVDRLFSGNELYFRDADGTAIMIHYAENYPQPEEYDEGYKTEFGGSEDALNAAQQAAENGDVWELVEVDNEGNFNGTIYGYAYGIDELKEYLKDLREVKVKKSLEEAAEFFGYSISDDIENYGGPVGFDRFFQRAINGGIEDEAFEEFGSRKATNVNKMARIRYKEYKDKFPNIPKDNSIRKELNQFITDINAKQIGKAKTAKNFADIKIEFENGLTGELIYNDDGSTKQPYILYIGHKYDRIVATNIEELKQKYNSLTKDLKEDMIDDNIEAARQDSIKKGLTSESEETDLDEPSEDDNKNILQAKKDELEARLGEILMSIKDKQMDTEEFRALSREAAEIDSQITDLDNQINGLYESEEEPNKEVKKECNTLITEATVSGKTLLKNQGNVYMFECKGNKDFTHIVGENYNESENLLENVETYTSKEEADKDYLKRCGLTEGYTSKDLAKDGGKYKKIDLYVDGKYETSTNSYKTVKEAIAALKNKDEYKDKKVTGEFSKQ